MRRKTDIALGDYERLRDLLVSKPQVVLRRFPALGIGCLNELACFRALVAEQHTSVPAILAHANVLGIPIEKAS